MATPTPIRAEVELAAGQVPVLDPGAPAGIGPYKLALRRLRRNRVALAFGAMFLLIVVLCLLAPVYSADIAHVGPNVRDVRRIDGCEQAQDGDQQEQRAERERDAVAPQPPPGELVGADPRRDPGVGAGGVLDGELNLGSDW